MERDSLHSPLIHRVTSNPCRHMAISAGLGIRTVAVFGHTNPFLYRPIGQTVNVIVSEDPNFAKEPSPILQQELFEVLIVLQ